MKTETEKSESAATQTVLYLRIPAPLHLALRELADECNESMNSMCATALYEFCHRRNADEFND
jgi:hypothetical protein